MQNHIKQVKIHFFKSYLSQIENSVGTKMFKNLYATVDGVEEDIMANGNLACARFVTNILYLWSNSVELIDEPHATVESTINDLKRNGWEEIPDLKVGSIIVWESVDFGFTGEHKHIGFFVGDNLAISNNSITGEISMHSHTFDESRKILQIFWNKKLVEMV